MKQKYKRSDKEIDDVLQGIGEVWKKYPTFRFSKLYAIISDNTYEDIYYMEDLDLTELFEAFHEQEKKLDKIIK